MKILKTIALPFIWLGNWVIQIIVYSIYVQSRVIKAPFPKQILDNFKHWNADTEVAIEGKQKDIFMILFLWVTFNAWYWFAWYWFLVYIVACIITVIVAFLIDHKRELKS